MSSIFLSSAQLLRISRSLAEKRVIAPRTGHAEQQAIASDKEQMACDKLAERLREECVIWTIPASLTSSAALSALLALPSLRESETNPDGLPNAMAAAVVCFLMGAAVLGLNVVLLSVGRYVFYHAPTSITMSWAQTGQNERDNRKYCTLNNPAIGFQVSLLLLLTGVVVIIWWAYGSVPGIISMVWLMIFLLLTRLRLVLYENQSRFVRESMELLSISINRDS